MSTIKVSDPPICCSTGVCGTDPDIALARKCVGELVCHRGCNGQWFDSILWQYELV